jgi:hypothetical protein
VSRTARNPYSPTATRPLPCLSGRLPTGKWLLVGVPGLGVEGMIREAALCPDNRPGCRALVSGRIPPGRKRQSDGGIQCIHLQMKNPNIHGLGYFDILLNHHHNFQRWFHLPVLTTRPLFEPFYRLDVHSLPYCCLLALAPLFDCRWLYFAFRRSLLLLLTKLDGLRWGCSYLLAFPNNRIGNVPQQLSPMTRCT